MLTHVSWHENSALTILGSLTRQKSIKTACGMRVAFARVDDNSADCPECLAIKAERDRLYEQAKASLDAMGK